MADGRKVWVVANGAAVAAVCSWRCACPFTPPPHQPPSLLNQRRPSLCQKILWSVVHVEHKPAAALIDWGGSCARRQFLQRSV